MSMGMTNLANSGRAGMGISGMGIENFAMLVINYAREG